MADIWWMLEQKFRGRTAELLAQFRAAANVDLETLSLDQLASLQGVAKNTVLLLRENKTRCVRREQAAASDPGASEEYANANFSEVKREVDAAIDEVLAKKAEFSQARVRLLSKTPGADTRIDLTDRLIALAELRRLGILSDQEFAKAKGMIL